MISSTRLSARRVAGMRLRAAPRGRAFNSTQAGNASTSNATNYALAGAAGGATALLGGYTYYRMSGLSTVVDQAKSLKESAVSAKNTLVEKTPSPNEAAKYLRGVAQSYGKLIPGAAPYIDSTFDQIDELSATHGDEVNKIVQEATDELKGIVKNGQADFDTAFKVADVLRRKGGELADLAAKAGQDVVGPFLEEHPELKDSIGSGWSQLKELKDSAQSKEARKLYDETSEQVQDIFKSGFSAESIAKAQKLVQEKTQQIKELTEKSSRAAWDKGLEAAKPYLDKAPEVRDLLQSNASVLISSGGASAAIWSTIKSYVGDSKSVSKENLDKLKDFVQSKVDEAQKGSSGQLSGAWSALQKYAETAVPGGKEALSQIPDLSSLIKVAQSNSEDAQKLAKSTYDEILEVLKKKSEEAKKLGQDAKEDVKKEDKKDDKKDSKKEEKKEKK